MAERGAAATGDLLVLMQWLSPAFPVGGFAYSHGLEWAISAGEVTGAAELCEWLSDVLEHGAGRVDATLLAQAMDPAADLDGLADLARALAPSAERLAETEDQGAAFARAVSATGPGEVAAMPFPVAFGAAARGWTWRPRRPRRFTCTRWSRTWSRARCGSFRSARQRASARWPRCTR